MAASKCLIVLIGAILPLYGEGTTAKRQVSSVRADYRTGKLIRTVKVVEAPVALKSVEIAPVAAAKGSGSIQEIVQDAASRHGLDPDLVHSVIKAESNYNPNAVSPVGASGLMQLMPATARQLGVHNAFNPKDNIEGGVKYLRYLQDKFHDPVLALAAYNAGPGSVAKYNNTVPPYRETQDYVVKVAKNYRAAKAASAAAVPVPAPPPPAQEAPLKKAEPEQPKEPETRKVQAYYDASGRMFLRTQ